MTTSTVVRKTFNTKGIPLLNRERSLWNHLYWFKSNHTYELNTKSLLTVPSSASCPHTLFCILSYAYVWHCNIVVNSIRDLISLCNFPSHDLGLAKSQTHTPCFYFLTWADVRVTHPTWRKFDLYIRTHKFSPCIVFSKFMGRIITTKLKSGE